MPVPNRRLSRRRQGFDSPTGRHTKQGLSGNARSFFLAYGKRTVNRPGVGQGQVPTIPVSGSYLLPVGVQCKLARVCRAARVVAGRLKRCTPSPWTSLSCMEGIPVQSKANDLWSACLKILKARSSDAAVDTWLRPMRPTVENDGFSLNGPNAFITDMAFMKFADDIRWALSQATGQAAVTVSRDESCGIRISFRRQ